MSKEATEQALEALENLKDNKTLHYTYADKVHMAITVLREELAEQIAQQEPLGTLRVVDDADSELGFSYDISGNSEQHRKLRDLNGATLHASPPAQQEPVAWPIETNDQVEALAKQCGWNNRRYMTPADYQSWCDRMRQFVQLASPQAQRTWVGLNDTDLAMRLALEALTEWQYSCPQWWDEKDDKAITALRKAQAEQPAQPQEPVAWMYPDDYERMTTSETFCTVYSVEVGSATRGESTVALYTSPPAQQKPLTDDPLQGAVDWLLEADGEYFCTATVQRTLRIGYNRAKRLCDTAKERAAHEIKEQP